MIPKCFFPPESTNLLGFLHSRTLENYGKMHFVVCIRCFCKGRNSKTAAQRSRRALSPKTQRWTFSTSASTAAPLGAPCVSTPRFYAPPPTSPSALRWGTPPQPLSKSTFSHGVVAVQGSPGGSRPHGTALRSAHLHLRIGRGWGSDAEFLQVSGGWDGRCRRAARQGLLSHQKVPWESKKKLQSEEVWSGLELLSQQYCNRNADINAGTWTEV